MSAQLKRSQATTLITGSRDRVSLPGPVEVEIYPAQQTPSTGRSVTISLDGGTITLSMLPEYTRDGGRHPQTEELRSVRRALSRVEGNVRARVRPSFDQLQLETPWPQVRHPCAATSFARSPSCCLVAQ